MQVRVAVCTSLTALALYAGVYSAAVADDNFDDGDASAWEPLVGEWNADEGAYLQSDASTPAYKYSVTGEPWSEGAIEADATPLEFNRNGNVGASFGLMVKFIDGHTWCAARFGSYGGCSLRVVGTPEPRGVKLGHFEPQVGRTYHPKVILRNGLLALALDGLVIAILEDPFPDQAGRPGLGLRLDDGTHRGDPTPLLPPSPRLWGTSRSYEGQAAECAENAENGMSN